MVSTNGLLLYMYVVLLYMLGQRHTTLLRSYQLAGQKKWNECNTNKTLFLGTKSRITSEIINIWSRTVTKTRTLIKIGSAKCSFPKYVSPLKYNDIVEGWKCTKVISRKPIIDSCLLYRISEMKYTIHIFMSHNSIMSSKHSCGYNLQFG